MMQGMGRKSGLHTQRVCPHSRAVRVPVHRCCSHTPQKCTTPATTTLPPQLSSLQQRWAGLLEEANGKLKQAASAALGFSLAATLVLGSNPALAETTYVRLPASADPGVFAAQRTLVEAWTIVGESFVDTQFNGHDWKEELKEHMMNAFKATEPASAIEQINSMLTDLGDPYTRRIPPEEYALFRMSAEGELQGVGLLIANEPVNGHLMVLAPIKGGPADRAGVMPGDEVASINGESTRGWSGEQAARVLRGRGGTEVRVKLMRRSGGIPGVPGRPEPVFDEEFKEVKLRRERVAVSPVYHTALNAPDGGKVGYLRLTQFSSNAANDMGRAIKELEADGASSYILDLRNNPGGLVKSGIDIAHLWLEGHATVFNISGRAGEAVQHAVVEADGAPLTRKPLAVLVNEGSASASEILSGALRDNGRAVVIGNSNTYGKGRIQSVFELQDGSALFVTVAKYVTPNGTEIDKKGIRPDRACVSPMKGEESAPFLPGIPVGPGSEDAMIKQLNLDGCVLAAQAVLKAPSPSFAAAPASARPLSLQASL